MSLWCYTIGHIFPHRLFPYPTHESKRFLHNRHQTIMCHGQENVNLIVCLNLSCFLPEKEPHFPENRSEGWTHKWPIHVEKTQVSSPTSHFTVEKFQLTPQVTIIMNIQGGGVFFFFLPFVYSFCFVYATPFYKMEREKIMSKHGAQNLSTA